MKNFPLPIIALAIIALLNTGCATIINGTAEKIKVSSEPEGAAIEVDGVQKYQTPSRVRLERRRDHVLVIKKEGYEDEKVKMTHVLSEAVCGNLFLGGPLGWIFDMYAGTQYKLIPNPVHVTLKKKG